MTNKILCAIDGTDHSSDAVMKAAELASKLAASMTVCTVNALQGGLRGPPIYLHDDAGVRKMLADAHALAQQYGAKEVSELELRGREIATAIIQYAEQNGFDHIVAGAGHRHGLSRLAMGSVAEDLVKRAHCSVTIAR
jgi:nucleotide-binding universal stress UspA family protein